MKFLIGEKKAKEAKSGQIFVVQTDIENMYLVGKVLEVMPTKDVVYPKTVAIQLYNFLVKKKENIPYEKLEIENTLLPLKLVHIDAWKKGFFETVTHIEIEDKELKKYGFYHRSWDEYYSLKGSQVEETFEIVNDYRFSYWEFIEEFVNDYIEENGNLDIIQ